MTTPAEEDLQSGGTEDVRQAEDTQAEELHAVETRPVAAAPRRSGDAVARALWLTIAVVIILALVTVAYGLLTNVVGTGAPKTMSEFKIESARAKIDAGSKERPDWLTYIVALTNDGQYAMAQEWIDRGTKTLKNLDVSADMLYAQAQLYAAQGQYDKAIKSADQAINMIQRTHDVALAKWKKDGQPTEASSGLADNYWSAVLLKADVYAKKGNWKSALAAYNRYLAGQPTAATVYTQRGAVKEKLGDAKGATADYKRTLTYIPDDADALAALKRIGAAK